jgi:hypothetical protein
MTQRYYKFLARGARGPVTEVAWPVPSAEGPGAWLETTAALAECRSGVHVCRTIDLSHWLHDELWSVEVSGEQRDGRDCVIAARGRLVSRIAGWSPNAAARFAKACCDHASEVVEAGAPSQRARLRELLADAAAHLPRGNTALAAYCSAMAVAWLHGGDHFDTAGYRSERAWQSDCIVRELALD